MMKIISYLIAVSLLASAPAFADQCCAKSGTKGDFAEKKVDHMKEKLALSDAQAGQLKSVFDAKKEKMEAIKKEMHAQVLAILTPEQKEKYEVMKQEWKEKRDEKHDQ